MNVKVRCPSCGAIHTKWVPAGLRFIDCSICGDDINVKEDLVIESHDSVIKKRSMDQEKRAAKRWDAREQPGSGAMDHAKGDVRKKGVLREECKFTLAKSYSVKLAELMKIEREAKGDEIPFLEVEFQGVHPYHRYYILPEWAFQTLMEKKNA